MDPNAITPELLARLQADAEWRAINTQLEAVRKQRSDIETKLVADRELAARPQPPQTRAIPGTWGVDPRRETNPDYTEWQRARANVRKYDNPDLLGDDTALKALDALRKQEADLELDLGKKASDIQDAKGTTPIIREVNGVTSERQPDGTWKPIEVAARPPIGAGEGVDPRLVGKPKGTTIGREIETGPGGNRYYVEYFYGPDGRKGAVASDEDHRPIQVGGGLGTDPNAPIALQTAQTNLQIAQQRLAEATSPEARQKAQLEVQQAQLALQTAQLGLEQTRERSPIDLATAQTNLALAQQRLAEATSPEAKEQRQIELEQARFELEQAKAKAPLDREIAGVNLETARANLARSQQLQDPVAEYQRQVGLLQTSATQYRDDLNDKIMRGELSVEDANRQFDGWWGTNVEAKLQPYQTMAEASYRKEQNDYQTKVAAEQARVDAINRQREQVGYQAGETARAGLNALAPQARSPEFLAQFAQNVSNIGKPLPGGPSQHSGGMHFSPESLSLENVRRAMPNLTEVGQNAAARALASISPAAAQSVGAPPPQVPGLPQFQDYMNKAPFQIPNPALPIPGRAALDLGSSANAGMLGLPVQPGYAATQYQGGRIEPWQIPG